MNIDDVEVNPWASGSTVPTRCRAEDMENDPSGSALILHQHLFQDNMMHPAKRQADVNQQALPIYLTNEHSMIWLRSQHRENTATINSLRQENMGLNQQIQGLWFSCHTREGRLNKAQKAEERARKELDEQVALMKTMETRMKETEENMRQRFAQLEVENERTAKEQLLRVERAMKQKDNEIVSLNTRVNAVSSSVPQASTSSSVPQALTSMPSPSTGPAPASQISSSSSNLTSAAVSSSTAPNSSSPVLPSSTRTETTASNNTPRVISSSRVGTGQKAVKIAHNDVILPVSPFRAREQASASSRQEPQPQEDTEMDEPDGSDIDDATLNTTSTKELLKMGAKLLQAAISGNAQLRREDVGRKYPSKKTSARMGQRENMSKAEINAIQTFIRKEFLALTGMTTLEEFVAYEPVDESIVVELRNGTGDGPDKEQFTLDFSAGYGSSKWNCIILAKMTNVVQDELLKEGHLVDVDKAYVEETLRNHLSAACQKWTEAIPRLKKDMLEFETESEVVDRVAETGRRTQAKAQGHASKTRKYKTRTEIVKKVIFLKTKQKADDLPVWKFMQRLMEYLGKDGMSSEESHTRICLWRHEKIIEYMDEIDARGRDMAKRGNKAAPRDRETRPRLDEEVNAPTRLPEALYDPAWLESLDEDEREELVVSEEVFELLEREVPNEVTIDEVE
ncbi:hypothetical protein F5146DRAFT_1144204 [Armillaria mellea]|nr:hypothetical protein F5146DRAFT_1144204 [Armillaria mellea]